MRFDFQGENVFIGTGRRTIDTAKPSAVFIHGAGMDHTVWLVYERYFAARGFNALSIDLPAHGRSGGAPLPSVEAMAEWVDCVLQQLNITDAVLIGHSMGSLVAFECAARNPERTRKVVLLGFSYPMAVGPALLQAASDNDPAAIDMMVIFGHDLRAQIGGNPSAGVSVINSAKRLLEKNLSGVLFNDLNACNTYQNGDTAAATITCPVVFISGDSDKMTAPRAAAKMAGQVAEGTMLMVANSGHGVMAEQPEPTRQLLVEALSS